MGTRKSRYMIPDTLNCDRLFLRHPSDCVYVEAATRYLQGLTVNLPILRDELWSYPNVADLEGRVRGRNWAVGAAEASLYYGRIISPTDWITFCDKSFHGRFKPPRSTTESMIIPSELFPEIPERLRKVMPTPLMGIETPRMGFYFGWTVSRLRNEDVKRRYEDSYIKEFCVNFVISFLNDMKRGRVWDIRKEFDELLKDVIFSIPDIPQKGNDENSPVLGDFSKIRNLMNPWANCEYFVIRSARRFERRENVYTSKVLFYAGMRLFISTESLFDDQYCETESLISEANEDSREMSFENEGRTSGVDDRQSSSIAKEAGDLQNSSEGSPTTNQHTKRRRPTETTAKEESDTMLKRRRLPFRTCKKSEEK